MLSIITIIGTGEVAVVLNQPVPVAQYRELIKAAEGLCFNSEQITYCSVALPKPSLIRRTKCTHRVFYSKNGKEIKKNISKGWQLSRNFFWNDFK